MSATLMVKYVNDDFTHAVSATSLELTAYCDVFTTSLKGLVPAPVTTDGTKYLCDDGTWKVVASGGGSVDLSAIDQNIAPITDGDYTLGEVGKAFAVLYTVFIEDSDGVVRFYTAPTDTQINDANGVLQASFSTNGNVLGRSNTELALNGTNVTANGSFYIIDGNSFYRLEVNGNHTRMYDEGQGLQIKLASSGNVIGGATTNMAFFGGTPAAKPTGVPVTAGGVHAALVTLGLISA